MMSDLQLNNDEIYSFPDRENRPPPGSNPLRRDSRRLSTSSNIRRKSFGQSHMNNILTEDQPQKLNNFGKKAGLNTRRQSIANDILNSLNDPHIEKYLKETQEKLKRASVDITAINSGTENNVKTESQYSFHSSSRRNSFKNQKSNVSGSSSHHSENSSGQESQKSYSISGYPHSKKFSATEKYVTSQASRRNSLSVVTHSLANRSKQSLSKTMSVESNATQQFGNNFSIGFDISEHISEEISETEIKNAAMIAENRINNKMSSRYSVHTPSIPVDITRSSSPPNLLNSKNHKNNENQNPKMNLQDNFNDQSEGTTSARTTVQLKATDDNLNIRENFGNIRNQVKAQKALDQKVEQKTGRGAAIADLLMCCIRPKNCQ